MYTLKAKERPGDYFIPSTMGKALFTFKKHINMTVRELIEKLNQFPDHFTVLIDTLDYSNDIQEVKQHTMPDFDTVTGDYIGDILLQEVLITEA